MALATVDADGLPNVRMVLLKGFDCRRPRLLHQSRIGEGPRIADGRQGRAVLLLEEPAPPDPQPRPGHAGQRGRGRRLFREPPARQPHRRLGEPAIAASRKPLRPREGGRAARRQICRRPRSRARPTGPASASPRSPSSSGRTAPSACTTACCSCARARDGGRRGCIRSAADGAKPRRSDKWTPAPRGLGSAPSSWTRHGLLLQRKPAASCCSPGRAAASGMRRSSASRRRAGG